MPISFHVDIRQRCIFIRLWGVLTEWDTGVAVQHMWHDPNFDPSFDRLPDASAVEDTATRRQFVYALASDEKAHHACGRIALIARGRVLEGFEQFFAPNAGGVECRGFLDQQDALEWLGVQAPIVAGAAD